MSGEGMVRAQLHAGQFVVKIAVRIKYNSLASESSLGGNGKSCWKMAQVKSKIARPLGSLSPFPGLASLLKRR